MPFAFGLLALALGQDASWDLRNYHYYVASAWLNGRLGLDVAVAYHNTFHNPTLDLITYFGRKELSPKLFGFLLGSLHGLNCVVLFLIARLVCPFDSKRMLNGWAACAALAGSLGAGALGELGATFGDNVVSLPLLGALCVYLSRAQFPKAVRWLLMGLLVGSAAGLKPSALFYVLSFGFALLTSTGGPVRSVGKLLGYGVGFSAGFWLTAGHWCMYLWRTYGNPSFPYANDVFRSPDALPWNFRDVRYLPHGIADWLLTPFFSAFASLRVGEVSFLDLRIPAALIVMALYGLARWRHRARPLGEGARFLAVAFVAALVLWIGLFSIYRYVVPLEMLAPCLIAALISRLELPATKLNLIAMSVCAVCLIATRAGQWGRKPWGADLFGFTLPPVADLEQSLVFVSGTYPLGYVAAALPPTTPMLRLEGSGDPTRNPDFPGPVGGPTGLEQVVRARISAHTGPMYLLARTPARADYALNAHHLYRTSRCHDFKPYIEDRPLHLCEVARSPR
ncbi:MAG TPA: hypothetical protein VER96_31290 [Polyangiaceae bacterium]|nr:hypothetical protein [Polyangiaceae bacterium]